MSYPNKLKHKNVAKSLTPNKLLTRNAIRLFLPSDGQCWLATTPSPQKKTGRTAQPDGKPNRPGDRSEKTKGDLTPVGTNSLPFEHVSYMS